MKGEKIKKNSFQSLSNALFKPSEIPIKAANFQNWLDAISHFKNNVRLPLWKTLKLNAINTLVGKELEQSILILAISAETAKDVFLESTFESEKHFKIWKDSSDGLRNKNIASHLDEPLKRRCGKSFRESNPDDHANIDKLWQYRNKLAHGKIPEIWYNDKKYELRETFFFDANRAVDRLFEFLEGLVAF